MKKAMKLFLLSLLTATAAYANAGTFTGYSWKGEATGVKLEEATEKVESKLTLDESGVIKKAEFNFLVKKGDTWVKRNEAKAKITFDTKTKGPVAATPGKDYKEGVSQFKVEANDMMGLYAFQVIDEREVVMLIVDPITRYQFEARLPEMFNYDQPLSALTVGNGLLVPTKLTSSGGLVKVENWDELKDKGLLDYSPWSEVITSRGVFKGFDEKTTIKEFLVRAGSLFNKRKLPKPSDLVYGYYGAGGWAGNYSAVSKFLTGKNANELKSLIDYKDPKYAPSVDKDNFFGIVAGATRTVQNSVDTIAGATIRMSRENEAYQRALVAAGLLKEEEVVKGRF